MRNSTLTDCWPHVHFPLYYFSGCQFISLFLRNSHTSTNTIGKPPLICGQQSAGASPKDKTGQKKNGQRTTNVRNTQYLLTSRGIIFVLEKNPMAEPGIESRTSGLVTLSLRQAAGLTINSLGFFMYIFLKAYCLIS